MSQTAAKEWLNTKETSDYIGYSESTLENWRNLKRGPKFYKPLGRVLYLKEDLDEWLKEGVKND